MAILLCNSMGKHGLQAPQRIHFGAALRDPTGRVGYITFAKYTRQTNSRSPGRTN